MWDAATPAIQTMLRGLCGEEIVIRAADRDLHSGFYGSAAANPNHVLARILADLHDADGRVTLPGFYDGVPELPAALRAQWDDAAVSTRARSSAPSASRCRQARRAARVLEMTWSRPTCEVNGMGGGYQGEGFKTVIPSRASAKISFRLVFDQDPHAIRAAFRDFVRARRAGRLRGGVPRARQRAARSASRSKRRPSPRRATRSPTNGARAAVFIGGGGSIPVTHELKNALGMDVVLAGFALEDDRIHSPNEKYELESFRRGMRSWARILRRAGEAERGEECQTMAEINAAAPPTSMQRILDVVERVGNRVPHPVIIFVILIGIVIVLSHVFYMLGPERLLSGHQPGDRTRSRTPPPRPAAC